MSEVEQGARRQARGGGDGRASASSAPPCCRTSAAAGEDFEVPKALCHLPIFVSLLASAGGRSV